MLFAVKLIRRRNVPVVRWLVTVCIIWVSRNLLVLCLKLVTDMKLLIILILVFLLQEYFGIVFVVDLNGPYFVQLEHNILMILMVLNSVSPMKLQKNWLFKGKKNIRNGLIFT